MKETALANCRQCGAALPAISYGELSDHCSACRNQQPSPKNKNLLSEVPQLSASIHRWLNATNLLLGLNFGVFIAMMAAGISPVLPDTDQLLRWGADYGPYTLSGQYWRVITSSFVHIGLVHLLLNMWCLWRLGRMLEKLVGAFMTFSIYLLTAVGAGILSLSWNPMRVSAGASGAIFGIVGVLISIFYYAKLDLAADSRRRLLGYVTKFALLNLLYGLKENIDNMAHLGGLVTGLLIGLFLARSLNAEAEQMGERQAKTLGFAALTLLLLFIPVVRAKAYVIEFHQGKAALDRNDYTSAIQYFQRYTRLQENDASGHAMLGYSFHTAERYDEAAPEYQRALQLQPDYPAVELNLARVYMAQNKKKEAVPLFAPQYSPRGSRCGHLYGVRRCAAGHGRLSGSGLCFAEVHRIKCERSRPAP